MKTMHLEWVEKHYPTPEKARIACLEATLDMAVAFTDLTRVRGVAHVKEPFDLPPTRAPHWWLVDYEGNIIDPTAHQYPTEILKYDPVDESRGEPTGKCPNCEDLAYGGQYFCSDKCEKSFAEYLNG